MLFRDAFCATTRDDGSAEKMSPSQAENKISSYFGLWFVLPHEISGAYKNDIIPDGTQDFMLLWDVFRATTRGVGVVKHEPP